MAYTWNGMMKLSWKDVQELHDRGELAGCYYLYQDDSEGQIDSEYEWEDIEYLYGCGIEFGIER